MKHKLFKHISPVMMLAIRGVWDNGEERWVSVGHVRTRGTELLSEATWDALEARGLVEVTYNDHPPHRVDSARLTRAGLIVMAAYLRGSTEGDTPG